MDHKNGSICIENFVKAAGIKRKTTHNEKKKREVEWHTYKIINFKTNYK